MLRISQLRLPIEHSHEELLLKVQKQLRCKDIQELKIIRRSVDARKKPALFFEYTVDVKVKGEQELLRKCRSGQVTLVREVPYRFPVSGYQGTVRPVIVGMGPAGLFCGYMLAKAGFRPILLERGKAVEDRTRDVEAFWDGGSLNERSNVQFGEGGAGTFSDGKLNTLVKDKYGRNRKVLELFVECGAPKEILYDYKPHIGTDVLRTVVRTLRERILQMGGEVHFSSLVTEVLLSENGNRVTGVKLEDGTCYKSDHVILAPGHSARDTFEMLYEMGISMEAKPFAVGMRVEHPQRMINLSQYGREQVPILGSAPYKVTARAEDGRGVYSFCMCPGGYVVNASSKTGQLAVNGMSYSGRKGENANSAIIITVSPEDFGKEHPLSGVRFQQKLEEAAYGLKAGSVPVERYKDFYEAVRKERKAEDAETFSEEALLPCIKGKWEYGNVHEILPENLNRAFVDGMEQFGRMIKGFSCGNALIEGIESRTSSPLRILRGNETLEASLQGLYPCGEGAGYAGGITSAAMDGIHVAEVVAQHMISAG